EQIVGLLVALQRFIAADEPAEVARQGELLQHIADRLRGVAERDGTGWPTVTLRQPPVDGRIPYPILAVDFGGAAATDRAAAVAPRSSRANPGTNDLIGIGGVLARSRARRRFVPPRQPYGPRGSSSPPRPRARLPRGRPGRRFSVPESAGCQPVGHARTEES